MVAATAAPNAGTDSVALRLWASLSSCSTPKEYNMEMTPEFFMQKHCYVKSRVPRSLATKDGGALNLCSSQNAYKQSAIRGVSHNVPHSRRLSALDSSYLRLKAVGTRTSCSYYRDPLHVLPFM